MIGKEEAKFGWKEETKHEGDTSKVTIEQMVDESNAKVFPIGYEVNQ